MTEIHSIRNDLASIFRQWTGTTLTKSSKRCSILACTNNSSSVEVDELLNSLRQNKLTDSRESFNESCRRWWDASSVGNLHEMVRILSIDRHMLNWKNPLNGWTALHYVAKIGNIPCLELLVKQHNCDVDVKCKNGCTPLHISVMHSQRLFVRSLVQIYHARTDIMDHAGRFPYSLLPEDMREDFLDLLTTGRLAEIRKQLSFHDRHPLCLGSSLSTRRTAFMKTASDERLATLSMKCDLNGSRDYWSTPSLSQNKECVTILFRRLRHGVIVEAEEPSSVWPNSTQLRKSSQRVPALLRKSSLLSTGAAEKKLGIFKVPHLPNPSRHGAVAAVGTLLRRGREQISIRRRNTRKKSLLDAAATRARNSFAGVEHFTARLRQADRAVVHETLNASQTTGEPVMDGYELSDSTSSSLSRGRLRTSSMTSLEACTEDLFSQYFSVPAQSPR